MVCLMFLEKGNGLMKCLVTVFSLVDVQMRLLLRGTVTCKVLHSSTTLTNMLTPVVCLYLTMLLKLPK